STPSTLSTTHTTSTTFTPSTPPISPVTSTSPTPPTLSTSSIPAVSSAPIISSTPLTTPSSTRKFFGHSRRPSSIGPTPPSTNSPASSVNLPSFIQEAGSPSSIQTINSASPKQFIPKSKKILLAVLAVTLVIIGVSSFFLANKNSQTPQTAGPDKQDKFFNRGPKDLYFEVSSTNQEDSKFYKLPVISKSAKTIKLHEIQEQSSRASSLSVPLSCRRVAILGYRKDTNQCASDIPSHFGINAQFFRNLASIIRTPFVDIKDFSKVASLNSIYKVDGRIFINVLISDNEKYQDTLLEYYQDRAEVVARFDDYKIQNVGVKKEEK
ncbi:MAG: hypothetical protein Q4A30_01495, partial [Candidatus Saccharibacteria bacterium]|nr:hypothetical protein [Candidatus Saccharibacteria bacterium]